MKTIGQRIKEQRLALGITKQQDLAKAVDLDQSSISGIERHNVGFTAATLMKLSRVLGVTPDYIMEGRDGQDVGESEIVAVYRMIEERDRATLLKMARGLVPALTPVNPDNVRRTIPTVSTEPVQTSYSGWPTGKATIAVFKYAPPQKLQNELAPLNQPKKRRGNG